MAKLYYRDKPIIGLDISQTGIKVMAVNARKWLVSGYGSIDLDPTKVQQSLDKEGDEYLTNNLKALLEKNIVGNLPSDHVVVSVPTNRTFTRTFTAPLDAKKHLKDTVDLEVDQYIPLPSNSLYIDHEIIDSDDKSIVISLSAVPRTLVDRCVDVIEAAGLRPCAVEPSAHSVARILESTEEGHLPTVIIDIGPATTDIAILDRTIRLTGSIGIGGNTFTLAIAKKLHVPLETAHQLKVLSGLSAGPRQQKIVSALESDLDRIVNEVKKLIRYYNERLSDDRKLEQVLIVGAGSNVPGIGDFFTDRLFMAARVAAPWQRLNFGKLPQPAKQFRPRYITVAGAASVPPQEILK